MSRNEASKQILDACREIAKHLMKITPAIPHLQDESTQLDCLKAAHQLTRELETIKKRVIQLQNRDDSADL